MASGGHIGAEERATPIHTVPQQRETVPQILTPDDTLWHSRSLMLKDRANFARKDVNFESVTNRLFKAINLVIAVSDNDDFRPSLKAWDNWHTVFLSCLNIGMEYDKRWSELDISFIRKIEENIKTNSHTII